MRSSAFPLCVAPLLAALLVCSTPAAGQPQPGAGGTRQPGAALVRTEKAFPSGDRETSAVLIERYTPAEVRRGEAFTYEIRLVNLARVDLSDLVLTEQIPAGLRVRTITPQPTRTEQGRAVWQIPTLRAGGALVIQVLASIDQLQELNWCATVHFSGTACTATRIVEPKLVLTKQMPPDALLCDEIPIRFVVGNNGSGIARNVRVIDRLPAGMSTVQGRNEFMFTIGDLAAGQMREFTVNVRAARPGSYQNSARATDDSGLSAEAAAGTVVRQPILAVTKRGPEVRYIGRPAQFEIVVQNTGDAPARDTVLTDVLPPGLDFVSADGNPQAGAGRVVWQLGTIQPREARTVRVLLNPRQRGLYENVAVAKAYCAEAQASTRIDVRGIPAILLEVIDVEDPIEVGSNLTYVITVTNQGSAEGTGIVISCTLPPQQDFVSADGPTRGAAQGKNVTFASLPSLPPGAKATYKVVIKGNAVGDTRFRVTMNSDQIETIVEETESTRIY